MSDARLDRDTIERALAVSDNARILIALSGGGDSVALMHLLVDELGAARLRACVVDHALRPESAEEAATAAGFARQLGVAAEIATVRWDEPGPRSQSEARTRRYQALCAEARRAGACVIALGHTREDQIETLTIRGNAKSGWRGMIGMPALASAPLWPDGRGVSVVRPLLNARRESLRDLLRGRGASWIEDPSNTNTKFERVRVRQSLLDAGENDLARIVAEAAALAPKALEQDVQARALIAAAARFAGEKIEIDGKLWRGDAGVRQRALEVLIAAVSGEDRQGAPAGLTPLEMSMCGSDFAGATLGGARLEPVRGDVRLSRDRGAILGRADGKAPLAPLSLSPGEVAVWDGRLQLSVRQAGWSVTHDETGAPVLVNGDQSFGLAEAEATGIVQFQWLLEAHVAHLLAAYRR